MLSTCNLTIGIPGSGKGIDAAVKALACLKRSVNISTNWQKMGFSEKPAIRQIGFNYHIRADIMEKYQDRLFVWHDPMQFIFTDYPYNTKLRKGFDLFIDELSWLMPNHTMRDDKIHPEVLRFFAQHRHRGVQIFANTQDYKMVDINFRRMLTGVQSVSKICGSGDPDPTLPPVNYIWGLIIKWNVDKRSIENDDTEVLHDWLPAFYWLDKEKCSFYDTLADINSKIEYDFKHRVRKCKVCNFKKTYHD